MLYSRWLDLLIPTRVKSELGVFSYWRVQPYALRSGPARPTGQLDLHKY